RGGRSRAGVSGGAALSVGAPVCLVEPLEGAASGAREAVVSRAGVAGKGGASGAGGAGEGVAADGVASGGAGTGVAGAGVAGGGAGAERSVASDPTRAPSSVAREAR